MTPFCKDPLYLKSNSIGKNELLIILPKNDSLADEIELLVKTRKYNADSLTAGYSNTKMDVIHRKAEEMLSKEETIKASLLEDLGQAEYWYAGQKIECKSDSPKGRAEEAVKVFIEKVYTQLSMAGHTLRKDSEIASLVKSYQPEFSGTLSPAQQEMINFISREKVNYRKVTAEAMIDHFQLPPYGWNPSNILYILTELYLKNQVVALIDSQECSKEIWIQQITNVKGQKQIELSLQAQFTPQQLFDLKKFSKEFFNSPLGDNVDGPTLVKQAQQVFNEWLDDKAAWSSPDKLEKYPFLSDIQPVIENLKALASQRVDRFMDEFEKVRPHLLDAREKIVGPLVSFMKGIGNYDAANKFLTEQGANIACLSDDDREEATRVTEFIRSPKVYSEGKIPEIKRSCGALKKKIEERIDQENQLLTQAIAGLKGKVQEAVEFPKLNEEQKNDILCRVDGYSVGLKGDQYISRIQNDRSKVESGDFWVELLNQMNFYINENQAQVASDSSEGRSIDLASEPRVPVAEVYVSLNELTSKPENKSEKDFLTSEDDVASYLESLGKVLRSAIKAGQKISLR
jgi:hypothetical protein